MKYLFLLFGAVFGFLLSRAGATTFDFYAELFLFEDLHLMWVMATAALVGAIGIAVLRRLRPPTVLERNPFALNPKPMRRGLVAGSLLFGAGWGLGGACPGTALAMLGEGKLAAGVVVVGIAAGTFLYGVLEDRRSADGPAVVRSTGAEFAG